MKTIEDIYKEITRNKGVFEDKREWDEWVFEYACQTVEYEGADPSRCPEHIRHVIELKVQQIVDTIQECYNDYPYEQWFLIRNPTLKDIPEIIKREHER
jgi:hypothetical protein